MDWLLHFCGLVQVLFCMVDAGRTSKVVVRTNVGPLQGFKVLAGRSEVAVFRGIPYAEPPTGNKRFAPSQPITPWTNVLVVSDYGPACVQFSKRNQSVVGEEDCLTLNVFKPMLFEKENKNIPVVVFIHTGNFISGSGNRINGVELAKNLEAIVVSVNYRLGIFGFYSMRGHIKENLGILDQILGLKWIKDNIRDFSGDPNNVLLIGDQIMTSIHLMSPLSRVFFSRAISFDGDSFLTPISGHNFDYEHHRSKIEKICGDIKPNQNLPAEHLVWVCLRKMSVENLVNLSRDLVDDVLWHPFRPIYDSHVINIDSHIVSSFLHCDFMAFKSNLVISDLQKNNSNVTSCKDIFKSSISHIVKKRYKDNHIMLGNILNAHYFPPFLNHSYDYCNAVVKLLNDEITTDVISFANHHSRTGLTFLNFADITTYNISNSTDITLRQRGNIACILTNQRPESCRLPNEISGGISDIVRTFLYHGYPTVAEGVVWRPYTTTSKNFLQTTDVSFITGDHSSWPLGRQERLWFDALPDVGRSHIIANSPEVNAVRESVGLSWGLTEQQLEALIFSLILACLVLLCVTLTLFRIVCFVNGKTFYNKDKKQPRNDIVLKSTKKRKDFSNSSAVRVFHTQDINLNRRSGDHSDIEA